MQNFLITFLVNGEEQDPIEMGAADLEALLNTLLDNWVSGYIDLIGTMDFLRANGVEPPMEDEEVIEGENEPEIIEAADAVREIIGLSPMKQVEYVAAIREGGVLISLLA
jgi:hypothetical protein